MYRNYNADSQLNKTMTEEQFDRVVDAILSGKYSWACLLILRFAGYNPLHYIPHRTYNRLMKSYRENLQQAKENSVEMTANKKSTHKKSSPKLRDLCFMEEVDRQSEKIKGGTRIFSVDFKLNFADLKLEHGQVISNK